MTRKELTVKLDYSTDDHGSTAIFELMDLNGRAIQKLKGHVEGSQPLQRKAGSPHSSPRYPAYEVIDINGVAQLIEHRKMEPIFYVNQDPAVLKELIR